MEKINEIEYKPIAEVKTEGQFLSAICFKPKAAPMIILAAGIALLFVYGIAAKILGLFFVIMSLAVLLKVKDYKVMDIFNQGILFYQGKNAEKGYFVSYDQIEMWKADRSSGHDTLEFHLLDNRCILADTFEANKAYRILYERIKEKEERYLQAQKNKENSLSIPDAFEKLKDRIMKK